MKTASGVAAMAVVISAVAAGWAQPAFAQWDWRKCGSQHKMGAGWYNVRAHRVGCEKARTVARRWTRGEWSGDNEVTVDGRRYQCSFKPAGYEVSDVRCAAAGRRIVRFEVGS